MTHFAGFSAIVPDVGASVDFYRRAFGFALRYMHPSGQYAELLTGDILLSFTGELLWESMMGGDTPYVRARVAQPPSAGFIALIVDDVGAALDKATRAGAVKLTEPDQKPWGQKIALVRDLNGLLIELATPPIR
jgi:lactoylglutathione lyase